MAGLDGEWDVRRVSGALPPLAGVRKRVRGDRGETVLPGGLIGIPFRVRGDELRYRPPLAMVVDVLDAEPDGERRGGTTTVFGRPVGRFELVRRGR